MTTTVHQPPSLTSLTGGGVNPASVSASLYVGDLAPDVTEALLFDIFNAVGPVASIRVCRDAVTRRSLGYAYVNFHNAVDAERALDTMNFISIRQKPCRIMWSQRDPSLRKSGLGNVFVKNLDKTIDNKTLYDTFSMFGNILSCKVALDQNGESRGYGFVHYTNAESSEKAIAKVNGMVIAEKKVSVKRFIPKERRETQARRFTNVYVQGIPKKWSEDDLKILFKDIGEADSVCVARADQQGEGKGFGFVNFPKPVQAAAAVEQFDQKKISVDGVDYEIKVCRAMKKTEREQFLKVKYEKIKEERQQKYAGVNLYVKYLPDGMDDKKLRQLFEKFGTITSAKVMRHADGKSKGFGFVCFEDAEQSTKAMVEMNSKLVEKKPLYVALHQRKEVRRATLEKEAKNRLKDPSVMGRGRGRGGGIGRGRGMGSGPMHKPMYPQPMFNQGYNPQMVFQQQQMNRWQPNMPQQRAPMMQGNFRQQQMYPQVNPMAQGVRQPQDQRGGPPRGGLGPRNMNMPPRGAGGPPMNQRPVQGPMPTRPLNIAQPQNPTRPPLDANSPLTTDMLSTANPAQQKQMIGERIFPKIQHREPKLAGKITGMLLEMDNMELLHLLEDETALMDKINEALLVLNQHSGPEEDTGLIAE